MWRTTDASGSERSRASGRASSGARPVRARPVTTTPRRSRACVNAVAAAAAEPLAPRDSAPSTESAESARDSRPRNPGFQPGASRRASKCVSSPSDRARDAADAPARDAAREGVEVRRRERRVAAADEEEVAAPRPARELPEPETWVWKRYSGPRRRRATKDTASFSADAGASARPGFERNTTSPVRRSIASAAVRRASRPGARRARARAGARSGARCLGLHGCRGRQRRDRENDGECPHGARHRPCVAHAADSGFAGYR